jgi:hypothetical protein
VEKIMSVIDIQLFDEIVLRRGMMKLGKAVKQYVEAKEALERCMFEHFKSICAWCGYDGNCQVRVEYEEAWKQLKAFCE